MGEDLLSGMRGQGGLDILAGGVLDVTGIWPEAVAAKALDLGGHYVIAARNLHVAIELTEQASLRRSLVYLRDGNLHLFIRPGSYSLRHRFLLRPGVHGDVALTLTQLDLKAKLEFYTAKLAAILRRPPSQWLAVLGRLRKRSAGITGATLDTTAVAPADRPVTAKPPALDGWVLPRDEGVDFYSDIAAVMANVPATAKAVVADIDIRQAYGGLRPSLQGEFCPDRWAMASGDAILLTRPGVDRSALGTIAVHHLAMAIGRRERAPSVSALPVIAGGKDGHDAVSIIIPTKVHADLLRACIDSLALSPVTQEIVIVDNGATRPEMITLLRDLSLRPGVRVLHHDAPFNFSELCNLGARVARYPTLLFLNDDIEALDGDWLTAMLAYAARQDVGVVGARLLYPSRDLQHAGIATHLVPGPGHPWRGMPESQWRGHAVIDAPGEVDAVTAACLLIRRDLFQQVGGFDEETFAVTLNDVDLCLKVRARGLKVMYVPQATLLHKEGQSRDADDSASQAGRREREVAAFYRRHDIHAHQSLFCSVNIRRDSDSGALIPGLT